MPNAECRTPSTALLVAVALSLLAVGVPYWQIPYAALSLPNALLGVGLLVPLLAAAAIRVVAGVPFLAAVGVGLAVPCVVALRVVADVMGDPSSHNLWPFEVILASVVGLAVSVCGALLGGVVRLLFSPAAPPA
jgi:hypothetical protein